MTALSIRQPWAWLIVNGFKKVENRTWPSNYKGRVLIHAGKTMTREDYEACDIFVAGISTVTLPKFEDLQRGGIVGECEMTGCVSESKDPFFVGPYGFTLRNARPLTFFPCKGALSFFQVEMQKEAA